MVFTLEVAHTNIAKIAIYRQTYNFSCSEMKSQKTAAFYMAETGKIVGIVLGNHRKKHEKLQKTELVYCSEMIIKKKQIY